MKKVKVIKDMPHRPVGTCGLVIKDYVFGSKVDYLIKNGWVEYFE